MPLIVAALQHLEDDAVFGPLMIVLLPVILFAACATIGP